MDKWYLIRLMWLMVLTSYCLGASHDFQDVLEECGNAKVDLVLVIDSSGSVESVFEAYRDAAQDLVRMLPIGQDRTMLAIIQYNGQTFLKMEFVDKQNVEIVNQTVSDLEWLGGTTHSAEAVDLGISAYLKGRPEASKMFVLMTDGNSYNTWERVMETADRLHKTGARIYIVALGDTMYEPELEAYAGPNGTIIKKNDFNKFKGEILDLTGFVCRTVETLPAIDNPVRPVQHLVNATGSPNFTLAPVPYPANPAPDVPSTSAAPQTTPETSRQTRPPPTIPPARGCAADILFVLDSSGSVRNDFERQIQFMQDVIDTLTIDISDHLVAVVEYAGEMRQRLQFSFTAYLNKESLVAAIKALPFFSGTTATGEALKLGKHALGDRRPSVPAVVFVLTDGFSQDDVSGPAAALHSEPNVAVYAVGVTKSVNTKELLNIAGDSGHVYNDGNASRIKADALSSFLNCAPITSSVQTTAADVTQAQTTAPPTTVPPVPTTAALPSTTSASPITSASTTISTASSSTSSTVIPTTTVATTTAAPTNPPTTLPPITAETTTAAKPVTSLPSSSAAPTTPSLTVPTTESVSGCLLDLFFVLDSSGSVAQTFTRELEFAASIVDRLIIGPNNARIGALKYAGSGKSRVLFSFNKYSTAEDIKSAILATSFVSGTTATNEALQLAAQEYDSSKGARPGEARYIVVVFTDGFSQDDPGQGAKLLQSKGATLYSIGVNTSHPVNRAELLEIAGDESRIYTDETIGSLYRALDHLEKACKDAVGKGASNKVPLPQAQPKPQPQPPQPLPLPQPQPQPVPQPPYAPQPSSVIYGGTLSLSPPGPPTSPPVTDSPRRYPPRYVRK